MKTKVRKWRKFRRAVRKALYILAIAGICYYAAPWISQKYPGIADYFKRFGSHVIDTTIPDAYYDLLFRNAPPAKDLVLTLGINDDESLQAAIDRLKGVMGLGKYKIWLAHHDAETPPAYIKQLGYGDMGLLISSAVKERREEINLLTHELGHIYVWNLDKSVFGKCDQEKLVDSSGIFLGLGVLMLNGMTDEFKILPGQEYETRKKSYGYLKPEQIGYLLARYCADRGIAKEIVDPFLAPGGRKYFDAGYAFLRKKGYPLGVPAVPATGVYWCAECGAFTRVPLESRLRGPVCPKCG